MRSDWTKHASLMTAAALIAAANATAGTPVPVFTPIGDLPGNSTFSSASAVTSDGTMVVGASKATSMGEETAYWTAGSGLVGLGTAGPGNGSAVAVSPNGSIISGNYFYEGTYYELGEPMTYYTNVGYYWTQATGYVTLTNTALPQQGSRVNGMSDDGQTFVGTYTHTDTVLDNAGIWTAATQQWSPLPGHPFSAIDPDGDARSDARGCSPDASIITGGWSDPDGEELFPGFFLPFYSAFRWTQEGGMQLLGALPGGQATDTGTAVSADGTTIVGYTVNSGQPFRWTPAEGPIGMGLLPNCNVGQALGVSGDGSIIVGYCNSPNNAIKAVAFIWDAEHGMRSLLDVVVAAGATGLDGWKLRYATDISPDGRFISGNAENPSGSTEGFLIDLGAIVEPTCPADFNQDDVRDVADLFAYINAWLAKTPDADFNTDTTVDVADLFAYINAWLAGC